MDQVFKALADPNRRQLLDSLQREDGQTLSSLERAFPISRIAVMKHLRVLEDAGLVSTRRRGREKLHFLNTVPIRQAHERWISRYTETLPPAVLQLRQRFAVNIEKVFEIYIRTTPADLWDAITDSDARQKFHFGNTIESEWTAGSTYRVTNPRAASVVIEGTNLEVDPPRRLVQTFHATWSEGVTREPPSRVTWDIVPVADSCRLTLIHDQLDLHTDPQVYGGWPMVLSGLKTWLELSEVLTTPGSLLYG